MDVEYLKTAVGRQLARALTEIAISRPDRPIEYLAYYLISLHEKELELQKRQEHKKSKSVSKVTEKASDSENAAQTVLEDKISAKASGADIDETVPSLLSELVDKCVESYDPTLKDSLTDALSDEVVDSQLECSGSPIVVGSDAHLDERIDNLIIDPGENENEVFDAKVDPDMPQVYEVVSNTSEEDEGQNDSQ